VSAREIVIAVDPGAIAGWAIAADGVIVASGSAKNITERIDALDKLEAVLMGDVDERVVAVLETWTVGGGRGRDGQGTRWTPQTMIGLGASRGRWLEQLALAGLPDRRIVSVTPSTWRGAILDGLRRRTTDECKASAQMVARLRLGHEVGPDEAEAVCIALWAMHAREVRGLFPKPKAPPASWKSRRAAERPGVHGKTITQIIDDPEGVLK
jgi:hypothetical protein